MVGLAALFLAAASSAASPALTSSASWWEKVTYTITGDGDQQSCQYESSLASAGSQACDDADSGRISHAASSATGGYTKITIERRFSPGGQLDPFKLETGDTLLGGQVLALEIDRSGSVSSCETVATSKDLKPAYDCDEARAERFEASAGRSTAQVRRGLMTIIVYGHEEDLA